MPEQPLPVHEFLLEIQEEQTLLMLNRSEPRTTWIGRQEAKSPRISHQTLLETMAQGQG